LATPASPPGRFSGFFLQGCQGVPLASSSPKRSAFKAGSLSRFHRILAESNGPAKLRAENRASAAAAVLTCGFGRTIRPEGNAAAEISEACRDRSGHLRTRSTCCPAKRATREGWRNLRGVHSCRRCQAEVAVGGQPRPLAWQPISQGELPVARLPGNIICCGRGSFR